MSKKKIWSVIGLLALMWTSVTGQYLSIEGMNDYAYLAGIIDIIIMSVVMMIIPFIFRIINKTRLDFIKGRRVCKWNSIIVFIISIILSIILFDADRLVGIGGLGAIMYYFINKWLFVKDFYVNEEKEIKKGKNFIKENQKSNTYCKNCGSKLNSDKLCTKCGKKYFKMNYKILSIIFGIIIVLLLGLCFYLNSLFYNSTEGYIEHIFDDSLEKTNLQEKVEFYDENIVFVIDGYGNYYYNYDCVQELTGDSEYSYWAYNKEQAQSLGFKKGTC